MRILLLVQYYLPFRKSCAQLFHDLALEFRARGHQIMIISADDSVAAKGEVKGDGNWLEIRVNCGSMDASSRVGRALNEWRMSSRIYRYGLKEFEKYPCDLIVYYSPTVFFGSLVHKLKSLWRAKSYLILRDIFPQWAVDAGILRENGLPHRYFRRKEIEHHRAATVIGVQSPANLEYFRQQGWGNSYRLEVLYNWKTVSDPAVGGHRFRREMGLAGKVVFFYGGNIGVAQDMDNIVKLAEGVRDIPQACFLLVGEGSEVPRLKTAIQEKGLGNFFILPSVGQDEYLAMVGEADVGLISLDKNLRNHNFPGKLLDYMFFSKPILASINPGNDLKQALEGARCGFVSINGEAETLRRDAVKLMENAETRSEMGRNARSLLLKQFSTAGAAGRILEAIGSAA